MRIAILLICFTAALAADDTDLTPENVHSMRELWHRELTYRVSAPRLIGPIITHRGIKELVIVSDGSTIESIDADLGRVFWSKRIGRPIGTAVPPPAPVIAEGRPLTPEEEAAPPTQAIFVRSNDGLLHVLRPADGEEIQTPAPNPLPKSMRAATISGMEFYLDSSGLHARDARTGNPLYYHRTLMEPTGLAIAKDHVCLTAGRTVSCYGLPIEMQ